MMAISFRKSKQNEGLGKIALPTEPEMTQKDRMSIVAIRNLFAPAVSQGAAEVVTPLVERPGARIERIVSTGQASPPGFWYDQAEDEWVLLVSGAARLELEGEGEIALAPGDHVLLPAHRRHRVAWTDPDRTTVWLAVFVKPASGS